jgi:5-methyltetrahydropteroyltriglutamate--homocysteine methyltransferase
LNSGSDAVQLFFMKNAEVPMLPTCLVGSYPQPEWLIDRAKLSKQVPRVRARDLWLVGEEHLQAAQDDATLLAIRDQERAGIDIVSDGEQRRESYSNHFATALEGVDADNPGLAMSRVGRKLPVPRIVGKIRRRGPVEARDVALLRANTDRKIKATVPGPFTMSRQSQDDEPWMQQFPDQARDYGLDALNRALAGVGGTIAVHLCFGYAAVVHEKPTGYSFLAELESSAAQQISIEAAQPKLDLAVLRTLPTKTIILGVIDLSDMTVETPDIVAARIRGALAHVPPERLVIAPDCGMKYLPRAVAYGKMKAMVDGTRIVRQEVQR